MGIRPAADDVRISIATTASKLPFKATPQGIRVQIRLTPKAGRTALDDVAVDAAGVPHLKARVTAVPEKGKANKALLKLLSKEWGLSQSRLQIVAGEKDRNKTVLIEGDGEGVGADTGRILREWFDERDSG